MGGQKSAVFVKMLRLMWRSPELAPMAAFEPARQLYAACGFTYCEPFGNYVNDPNSVFMTMEL